MKMRFMFSMVVLAVIVSSPLMAQNTPNDPQKQEVPQFRVLSSQFITEAKGMFDSSWSTENRERTGLLVAVEASFAGDNLEVKPAGFFIEYSLGGSSRFDEECIGLASSPGPKPGEWVLVGPGVNGFLQLPRTEQGNATFALLFTVSKKIKEFSLIYRHPAAVVKAVAGK